MRACSLRDRTVVALAALWGVAFTASAVGAQTDLAPPTGHAAAPTVWAGARARVDVAERLRAVLE